MTAASKPSKPSKKAVALKGAKVAAKNPRTAHRGVKMAIKGVKLAIKGGKLAIKGGKPIAKRRARKKKERVTVSAAAERVAVSVGTTVERLAVSAEHLAGSLGTTAELMTIYAPIAALAVGLAEPPKRRSIVSPLAVGALIGATAVYLFGPKRSAG